MGKKLLKKGENQTTEKRIKENIEEKRKNLVKRKNIVKKEKPSEQKKNKKWWKRKKNGFNK